MTYNNLDSKTCIVNVMETLSGKLTLTQGCPVSTAKPGDNIVIKVKATNTGNVNNNSFVILFTVARSDNNAIIKSGDSGNIDIKIGATSTEYSFTFTAPSCNANVAVGLQADPLFNY